MNKKPTCTYCAKSHHGMTCYAYQQHMQAHRALFPPSLPITINEIRKRLNLTPIDEPHGSTYLRRYNMVKPLLDSID